MIRTDQQAKMAADAFFAVQDRSAVLVQPDRLMPAVRAGDHAASAAEALFTVELREDHRIALQNVRGVTDGIQRKPLRLAKVFESLLRIV